MPKAKRRAPLAKPDLPPLDPLEAAQEAARNAQEGNAKLSRAIDLLREGLETIAAAEWDHARNSAVSPQELRAMAACALDALTGITGQSWRRHPLVKTRVGDRSLPVSLEE